MKTRRHPAAGTRSVLFLALTVGVAMWLAWPGAGSAVPPKPIFNECACLCVSRTDGKITGFSIDTYKNTGGYACGVYSGTNCNVLNEDGSLTSGRLEQCGGYKPGGTRAMTLAPSVLQNAPVLRSRGIEPGSTPGEEEQATVDIPALMSKPGDVKMNCGCDGGTGSCSVSSTDGKTSTCQKGEGNTCSGTCKFPIGTISGISETP